MNHPRHERGSILLVVVFLATAIAILATISAGRVVTETRARGGPFSVRICPAPREG